MVDSYEQALGWIGDETTRIFDIAIENAPISGAVFVEIGTYRGKSSICLYDKIQETTKQVTLYTIDNWSGTEPHDQPGDDNRSIFLENKGSRNINLLEDSSIVACDLFQSESIDFLFIDNNAQGQDLQEELEKWIPKIKSGGIISGHDYNWETIKSIVDTMFLDVTVFEESTERVAEFDYQPPTYTLFSWHKIKD